MQAFAQRSQQIAERLSAGSLGIVGATYHLREGQANVVTSLGLTL